MTHLYLRAGIFIQMCKKKIAKRSFLLVEALVAIALLFAVGFAFFEIESAIIRKSNHVIQKAKAEIKNIASEFLGI